MITIGQTTDIDSENIIIAMEYVAAINSGDVNKIIGFLTDDNKFIDSQDNELSGKENLRQGWDKYFEWFPDYQIEIDRIYKKDNEVALFGYTSGPYKNIRTENNENFWRIPTSWIAIIENNKIKKWQVYSDSQIPYEIIKRNKKKYICT
ncbi:MAG: nuclear transport factor 2 family protein [Bacteroidota bacterium]